MCCEKMNLWLPQWCSEPIDEIYIHCLVYISPSIHQCTQFYYASLILQSYALVKDQKAFTIYIPNIYMSDRMTIQPNIIAVNTKKDSWLHLKFFAILGTRVHQLPIYVFFFFFLKSYNLAVYGDCCGCSRFFSSAIGYRPEPFEIHQTEIVLNLSSVYDSVFIEIPNTLPKLDRLTINNCSFWALKIFFFFFFLRISRWKCLLHDLSCSIWILVAFAISHFWCTCNQDWSLLYRVLPLSRKRVGTGILSWSEWPLCK